MKVVNGFRVFNNILLVKEKKTWQIIIVYIISYGVTKTLFR